MQLNPPAFGKYPMKNRFRVVKVVHEMIKVRFELARGKQIKIPIVTRNKYLFAHTKEGEVPISVQSAAETIRSRPST